MKNIVVACYFKGEQYLTFSAMKKGLEGSCNNYVIIRADIMSGMSSSTISRRARVTICHKRRLLFPEDAQIRRTVRCLPTNWLELLMMLLLVRIVYHSLSASVS